MGKLTGEVLFVRLCKNMGYCLSAWENPWGTICLHVQIDGVLFVRMRKSMRYYLSACANRWSTICPHVQFDRVIFVRMCKNDGILFRRGTICPAPLLDSSATVSHDHLLQYMVNFNPKRLVLYCQITIWPCK